MEWGPIDYICGCATALLDQLVRYPAEMHEADAQLDGTAVCPSVQTNEDGGLAPWSIPLHTGRWCADENKAEQRGDENYSWKFCRR